MLCLSPGMDHYEEMLFGAHFMDLHYLNTPLEQNVCHIVLHLLLLYMSSSPINVYNCYKIYEIHVFCYLQNVRFSQSLLDSGLYIVCSSKVMCDDRQSQARCIFLLTICKIVSNVSALLMLAFWKKQKNSH